MPGKLPYDKTKLIKILNAEKDERQGVQFIIVATSDGFLAAEAGVTAAGLEHEASRIATMSVSFCSLSHTLAEECHIGEISDAAISGPSGMMLTRLIHTKSAEYVLLICFNSSVNGGIANWAMEKTYEQVKQCLS